MVELKQEGMALKTEYPRSFVLQLVSLAGLHSTATITSELSRAFKKDGMLAYVNLVQRRERASDTRSRRCERQVLRPNDAA